MATPPDVDTAKVSRSSAIWVAAITACGGFATALATGSFGLLGKSKPPAVQVQRWIHIESVELARGPNLPLVDRIRLVAQVNGVSYGYPTSVNSVWGPTGPGMVGERYPLPIGTENYRIKFFGFGLDADGKVPRYEYRGVQEYTARQLPLRQATQALQLTTSDPKGLTVGMTVHYSIE
jgi:hypothetical protein